MQVPNSEQSLHSMNEQVASMEEERQQAINVHMDSLQIRNKEQNKRLYSIIQELDTQSQSILYEKELHIRTSYNRLVKTMTGLIISAIILLVISYWIIMRDIREKEKTSKRLEETIKQNASLLEMRKNIILTISHDIRAPLNVIDGSAELAMDTRDKKQRNNHLNNIRIVCKHITHLLNNLLAVPSPVSRTTLAT